MVCFLAMLPGSLASAIPRRVAPWWGWCRDPHLVLESSSVSLWYHLHQVNSKTNFSDPQISQTHSF